MTITGFIKKGEYFDSVSLMTVAKEVNKLSGVLDSAIVMGTKENKAIVKAAGLYLSDFDPADDTDLLISLKTESPGLVDDVLKEIEALFHALRHRSDGDAAFSPRSLEGALKQLPEANLSLISVAGKYAAREAMRALKNGLHVMLFSDNVSIEEEKELKEYGRAQGLLVMGPDCGTAIVNGVPLAFANVVNRGNVGIIGASGTGLQEVSTVVSNRGAGISQAIGTGGRDVKKEIGGTMFLEAMRALAADPETEVILLVSKPPHPEVLEKIAAEIKKIRKPVAGIFIGADTAVLEKAGALAAATLEECGAIGAALAQGADINAIRAALAAEKSGIEAQAMALAGKVKGRYLRGLFTGGTLCDEAQLLSRSLIGDCWSNTPLDENCKLADVWHSKGNTILDLGDDEFTAGRPHPMIDFSLRNSRILQEAADPDVAVILLDLVLGYGSHMDPAGELVPVISAAKKKSPDTCIIFSITGTPGDPQNRDQVKSALEKAGARFMPSNAAACLLAAHLIKNLGGK